MSVRRRRHHNTHTHAQQLLRVFSNINETNFLLFENRSNARIIQINNVDSGVFVASLWPFTVQMHIVFVSLSRKSRTNKFYLSSGCYWCCLLCWIYLSLWIWPSTSRCNKFFYAFRKFFFFFLLFSRTKSFPCFSSCCALAFVCATSYSCRFRLVFSLSLCFSLGT